MRSFPGAKVILNLHVIKDNMKNTQERAKNLGFTVRAKSLKVVFYITIFDLC